MFLFFVFVCLFVCLFVFVQYLRFCLLKCVLKKSKFFCCLFVVFCTIFKVLFVELSANVLLFFCTIFKVLFVELCANMLLFFVLKLCANVLLFLQYLRFCLLNCAKKNFFFFFFFFLQYLRFCLRIFQVLPLMKLQKQSYRAILFFMSCLYSTIIQTHKKGSNEPYLLGQSTTCEFSRYSPL